MRTRVILLLCAAWAAGIAQDSRPVGLLPAESPLAPVQEALLRGDSSEARAALDKLLGTAPDETLRTLGPKIALLRAATEPAPARAQSMLAVAAAYPDRPIAEAAVVAGLAALIYDGPEVGDLEAPLLSPPPSPDSARPDARPRASAEGMSQDLLLGEFIEILARRAEAPDRDKTAIEHARRLLAQFPSQVNDWVRVRPADAMTFGARLESSMRLRFYEIPIDRSYADGVLPDPSHLMLPEGPPKIDVTLPGLKDELLLPALTPGAWLVVARTENGRYRRAWPVLVTDLDLVVHSVPKILQNVGLVGGKPAKAHDRAVLFDPSIGSRTRAAQQKGVPNVLVAHEQGSVAIAPIAVQQQPPQPLPEQRLVADLLVDRPVYRPGDEVHMRLAVRTIHRNRANGEDVIVLRDAADEPVRIVLWPRQPHEVAIDARVSGSAPIDFTLPASAPPGRVRIQVLDQDAKPVGGLMPDPALDTIAFSIQLEPAQPVDVLLTGPSAWRAGDPAPAIQVLGLFRDGTPASGLTASIAIAAGSFRQNVPLVLGADGSATLTLGLDEIPAAALGQVTQVEVSARLLAADRELAKTSRRIDVAKAGAETEGPSLGLALVDPDAVAGEEIRVAVTGPAGEAVLLTVANRVTLRSQVVPLGADGRAEAVIPTEADWWPAIDLVCSTRDLVDPDKRDLRGRATARGRMERRLSVPLGRAGAPSVTIAAPKPLRGGEEAVVEIAVDGTARKDAVLVSLSVVDDRLLRFAGVQPPNPGASFRPKTTLLNPRVSGSPAPLEAVAWYKSVLGRDEQLTLKDDPRSPGPQGRAPGRSPPVMAIPDLGGWRLDRATAFFQAKVPLDAEGRGRVAFKTPNRTTSWRIVAVAIDAEGRSDVASVVVDATEAEGRDPAPSPDARSESDDLVTAARGFVEKPAPSRRIEDVANPPAAQPLGESTLTALVYPFPEQVSEALRAQIDRSAFPSADHIAARIISEASLLDPAAQRPRRSVPPALENDLALLRGLKTPDGYAWRAGEPTDFEGTPLVLHALSVLADAGVDPALFGASPDPRDGFLRVAPRAFAESQGNPMAALDHEDVRDHPTFKKSVAPERQSVVLLETAIGMLSADPALTTPKAALAGLLRQTSDLPKALLARAGRALFRAGDRESAALAMTRIRSGESPGAGSRPAENEIEGLALALELMRLLELPAPERDAIAQELARSCSREEWPRLTDAALAMAALRQHYGAPAGAPSELDVARAGPALCIATRSTPSRAPMPPTSERAPRRRLFRNGDDQETLPEVGAVTFPARTLVRLEITANPPAGRPCALACPIPRGARILSATLQGTASPGILEEDRVLWMIRAPSGEIRAEAAILTTVPGQSVWAPCTLIALDTLEVLGWSASTRFAVTEDEAAVAASPLPARALDPVALSRARDEAVRSIEAATDPAAAARELKVLYGLPDPGRPDAILALLPRIAPHIESQDAVVALVIALGDRRSELWTARNAAILGLDTSTTRATALADAVRDFPESRQLVARWLRDAPLDPVEARIAALIALARLRSSDPLEVDELWTPAALSKLLPRAGAPLRPEDVERIAAARELPFLRSFAILGANPCAANDARWRGWLDVLNRLDALMSSETTGPGAVDLVQLVAAVTEIPPPALGFFTKAEAEFAARRDELRRAAAERMLAMIETHALPIESANLTLVATTVLGTDLVPRLIRFLEAEIAGGRADAAIPAGVQALERRQGQYDFDDALGPRLSATAINGPRAWRAPALLALAPAERRRVPVVALEQMLRGPEAAFAVDLMLDRTDVGDLMRLALEQPLPRYEARRIVDRLAALEPHPFERSPLSRLLTLTATLDGEAAAVVEAEIARRADENPGELAVALAGSRDDRAREMLAKILAKAGYADVPWDASDVTADRIRTKFLALLGDGSAAQTVRDWMTAALQASQTQGVSESAVQDLWPYLAPNATPSDVLTFGAPASLELLSGRARSWGEDEIRAFLASPDAQPDPGATVTRFGSVAIVAKLIGPARAATFQPELLALWRAYFDAGLKFDALSLFGQMGAGQVAALAEAAGVAKGADSRPRRLDDAQKLAYIAALRRDVDVHRDVEPILRATKSDDVAKALARYSLEVTGYWNDPATGAAVAGPQTPQDWQRVLMTRLRNEGLTALDRAEASVLRAWAKTLRERGLLAR